VDGVEVSAVVDGLRDAQAERWRKLDPLLPAGLPPSPALDGDVVLAVPDGPAAGVARRFQVDPASLDACWGTLERHRLADVLVGGDRAAEAMDALLGRWRAHLAAVGESGTAASDPAAAGAGVAGAGVAGPWLAGGAESSAVLTWPSRDTAMVAAFLRHGLVARTVLAVRPAGRATPSRAGEGGLADAAVSGRLASDAAGAAGSSGPASSAAAGAAEVACGAEPVVVRELQAADFDAVVDLWLAEIRWDAQFGGVFERAGTVDRLRERVRNIVSFGQSWAWVAERGGELLGMIVVERPPGADWMLPRVRAESVGYISCLSVRAGERGSGVGTSLVAQAHLALDEAGVAATLLDYAALNPLSGPFWHRLGYRPLWTAWELLPRSGRY
jgi:ribosomal protein S18 acetylase RimI-like enzyme